MAELRLDRIATLLKFLDTEVRRRIATGKDFFYMSHFKKELPGCGTSACAAGWAEFIPEFRAAGYAVVESGSHCHFWVPAFAGEFEDKALMRFFGVNKQQALRLFYRCALTFEQELDNLRAFLAEHGYEPPPEEAPAAPPPAETWRDRPAML
jgi:hypothetical protein